MIPGHRSLWLTLAFTACILQVMSCSLPSLVVCYKADRPPRIEFFFDSCSCRLGEIHSCSDHGGPGASFLKGKCTDVPILCQATLTTRTRGHSLGGDDQQRTLAAKQPASGLGFLSFWLPSNHHGVPRAEAPPPLSATLANSRLRC